MITIPTTAIEGIASGLHAGISEDRYHQRGLGIVSKGALDLIHRSPEHYRAWVDGRLVKTGGALDFGRAFHMAVLEPEKFSAKYTAQPDFGDCRKTKNKEARDNWMNANAGRLSLSCDEFEAIQRMRDKVLAHPLAGAAIRGGVPELSITWQDEVTGLPCRSRADYYVEALSMVVDIKSTEDASKDGFRHSVEKYRYFVQDALYRMGFATNHRPIQHFVFVAVEKSEPYGIATYQLEDEAVARGYSAAREGIDTLADCLRADHWPSYPETIQTINIRPWAA